MVERFFYDPASPYQGYGNTGSFVSYQSPATQKLDLLLSLVYNDFYRESDKAKIYSYAIIRSRNTYQLNKYLFLRAIFEYNDFRKRMTVDTLVSFTYIPGTVMHIGYGSAFEQLAWNGREYVSSRRFLEMQRSLFQSFVPLARFAAKSQIAGRSISSPFSLFLPFSFFWLPRRPGFSRDSLRFLFR